MFEHGFFIHHHETLSDLSVHGAFLKMNGTYAIGVTELQEPMVSSLGSRTVQSRRVLDLRFTLPSADTFITCSAGVRDQRPGQGIGVEFLGLSSETSETDRKLARRDASLMSLTPGTTLGPYRVTAKIGEGGMDI